MEVSRLGIHVDPIIALFAPLWWLWPSPLLLLTVQAFAFALGAVPLFWLGRKHLSHDRDAALVAISYLLCPTVAWNAVDDFHAVGLAVPLLLFAIWYLDEDRLLAFAVVAGAATLCQEQIGLIVGCLGLWYGWRRRSSTGVAIAVAGFAVTAVDFAVVLRHFSGGTPYSARFGGTPGAILSDLFTRPRVLARQITKHDLMGLLPAIPVLGLCFGSTIAVAASPQVVLLLLSRRPGDWDWFGVNELLLIPFVYAATILTLGGPARASKAGLPNVLAVWVLATSMAVASVLGPISLFGLNHMYVFEHRASVSAEQQAVKLIPADAPVSATGHLALPLAARRYLYVFPVIKNAAWVLVDVRDDRLPDMEYIRQRAGIEVGVSDLYHQPGLMHRSLRRLLHSRRWRLLFRRDGIYVFKRARRDSSEPSGVDAEPTAACAGRRRRARSTRSARPYSPCTSAPVGRSLADSSCGRVCPR
jgi:uncharacterized membrane protein